MVTPSPEEVVEETDFVVVVKVVGVVVMTEEVVATKEELVTIEELVVAVGGPVTNVDKVE